jgi:hypothetical protein
MNIDYSYNAWLHARIYNNKLNTAPEHHVHSILYRSRTVFQMF